MSDTIRNGLRTHIASMLDNDIHYQKSNYYYFLGKIEPWGDVDIPPETTSENYKSETDIRSNALYFKKIGSNDVSVMTKRFNWEFGKIYEKWNDEKVMYELPFYCITNDNIVYKCLDNNGGVASTVKPEDKSFSVFRTSDGYLWKYMYTVPTFKHARFSSDNYIPVQKSLTDSFYNKGSIDQISITKSGSGYLDTAMTTIGVSTDTVTGSGASASIVTNSSGKIVGFSNIVVGNNYTNGVNLTIVSETGFGAEITANIINGSVSSFNIIHAGSGYIDNSTILFNVGGAVLIPSISNTTGSIEKITIVNGGIGYVSAPTLTVYSVSGHGTGKYGNTPILTAIVHDGKIVEVAVSDPGVGYLNGKDTYIIATGNGVSAAFTPVVYNGEIIDVIIENPGTGYTSLNLTVYGSGTDAVLKPVISASNFISDQSIVEQLAISGIIYAIDVVVKGTNYSDNTTISIVGDGTGCEAHPVVVNGTINSIFVTKYGKNYTYANIIIHDSARETIINSVDARAHVIFPPNKGHGYNAVSELFGNTVAINSSFREESLLNNIQQEYRQSGLIKNPTNLIDGKILSAASYLAAFSLILDNINGLILDEVIASGTEKYRVVAISSGNTVILQQLGTAFKAPIGILNAGGIGDVPRTYNALSITSQPIANKYSGDLLYVSDYTPFTANDNQGVTIKTYLKF